jgi:hypothetical protein
VSARCQGTFEAYREQVARTLGAGGPAASQGLDCLLQLLGDDRAQVRAASAEAIAAVAGDRGAVAARVSLAAAAPLRERAIDDPDADVRAAARSAYLSLPIAAGYRANLVVATTPDDARIAAALEANDLGDADPRLEPDVSERLRRLGYPETELGMQAALAALNPTAVALFLEAGFDASERFSTSWHQPPLVLAVTGGACRADPEGVATVVALLLAAGADPNVVDDRSESVLTAAARWCPADVIRAIVKAGADLGHANGQGMDAFMVGLQDLSPSVAVLLDAGYRLPEKFVDAYRTALADDPERLALVEQAIR